MTESSGKAGSTFFQRVRAEREAIRIVNRRFPNAIKLSGLSPAALDVWVAANAGMVIPGRLLTTMDDLFTLLGRMGDQSRTVFDVSRVTAREVDEAIRHLEAALALPR